MAGGQAGSRSTAGVAGGGDIILIPKFHIRPAPSRPRSSPRRKVGKKFSIVVIAEGASPKGGEVVIRKLVTHSAEPVRLGGVGFILGKSSNG